MKRGNLLVITAGICFHMIVPGLTQTSTADEVRDIFIEKLNCFYGVNLSSTTQGKRALFTFTVPQLEDEETAGLIANALEDVALNYLNVFEGIVKLEFIDPGESLGYLWSFPAPDYGGILVETDDVGNVLTTINHLPFSLTAQEVTITDETIFIPARVEVIPQSGNSWRISVSIRANVYQNCE